MKTLKKKAPAIAMAAFGVAILIGGTFAYFSESSSIDNYLSAKEYDSTIAETFTPPTDGMAPGVLIDKEVYVQNDGDVPMLVRISYTESWTPSNGWSVIDGSDLLKYDPIAPFNASYNAYDFMEDDGVTPDDDSLVLKLKAVGASDWYYGGVGKYYYYLNVLSPGEATSNFIDAIMLKDSTQTYTATSYDVKYYDAATSAFVTVSGLDSTDKNELVTALNGSVDATININSEDVTIHAADYLVSIAANQTYTGPTGVYQLTLLAETVQAIQDAADAWADQTASGGTVDNWLLDASDANIPNY